jgi:hypothetical protein
MKNKTAAAWLAFVGGPLGLHRMYLYGLGNAWAWLYPIPTALGLYGIARARHFGLDDSWSWVLIPLLGLVFSGTALEAIYYGLMSLEKWNSRFNPQAAADDAAGASHWLTIGAVVLSLMVGAAVLMATLAFGFQGYFEHEVDEARKISQ